jgi:hypothetical protein
LIDSIIALALGLLSYTILYTVNKQLVNFTFNPVSIDIDNSVASGVESADNAQLGGYSSGLGGLEPIYPDLISQSQTGWIYPETGEPCTPKIPLSLIDPNITQTVDSQGKTCVKQKVNTNPTWTDTTTPGNTNSNYNNNEITCNQSRCTSRQSTVFGFSDGDGRSVSGGSDNGIGNALYSDIIGCVIDTGHPDQGRNSSVATQGVALPMGFWSSIGFSSTDARLAGVKIIKPDGGILGVFPVVDNSSKKLDFTFGLVKYRIGQYDTRAARITNSNTWSASGYSFEIIKNYYRINSKQGVIYGNSTFADKNGERRSVVGAGPTYPRQTAYLETCTSTKRK